MLEPDDLKPLPGAVIDWNMPEHVYHGDPCDRPSLSSTIAKKLVHETPLHAWSAHPRLNPFHEAEEKDAFDIGSVAHTRLLGKGTEIAVIDADSYRTKAAQAEKAEARQAGRTPILREQSERVDVMVDVARLQLSAIGVGDVFAAAIGREVTFIAEVDGALCRCRVDALCVEDRPTGPVLIAYDYKTTAKIPTPKQLPRTLADLGYDIQDAHYTAVVTAATGLPCEMRFVVQEKSPPHLLSVPRLSTPWRELGADMAARAREVWRACLESGVWPGLPGDMLELDAPPWHATAWAEERSHITDARQRFGSDILARAFQFQAPAPLPAPTREGA